MQPEQPASDAPIEPAGLADEHNDILAHASLQPIASAVPDLAPPASRVRRGTIGAMFGKLVGRRTQVAPQPHSGTSAADLQSSRSERGTQDTYGTRSTPAESLRMWLASGDGAVRAAAASSATASDLPPSAAHGSDSQSLLAQQPGAEGSASHPRSAALPATARTQNNSLHGLAKTAAPVAEGRDTENSSMHAYAAPTDTARSACGAHSRGQETEPHGLDWDFAARRRLERDAFFACVQPGPGSLPASPFALPTAAASHKQRTQPADSEQQGRPSQNETRSNAVLSSISRPSPFDAQPAEAQRAGRSSRWNCADTLMHDAIPAVVSDVSISFRSLHNPSRDLESSASLQLINVSGLSSEDSMPRSPRPPSTAAAAAAGGSLQEPADSSPLAQTGGPAVQSSQHVGTAVSASKMPAALAGRTAGINPETEITVIEATRLPGMLRSRRQPETASRQNLGCACDEPAGPVGEGMLRPALSISPTHHTPAASQLSRSGTEAPPQAFVHAERDAGRLTAAMLAQATCQSAGCTQLQVDDGEDAHLWPQLLFAPHVRMTDVAARMAALPSGGKAQSCAHWAVPVLAAAPAGQATEPISQLCAESGAPGRATLALPPAERQRHLQHQVWQILAGVQQLQASGKDAAVSTTSSAGASDSGAADGQGTDGCQTLACATQVRLPAPARLRLPHVGRKRIR
jgi:hypothetical protein